MEIDSCNTRNLVSVACVKRLGIKEELHCEPYKLKWVNNLAHLIVAHRHFLQVDLVNHVMNSLYFDVLPVDIIDILIGRPWFFDWVVIHHARSNSNIIIDSCKETLVRADSLWYNHSLNTTWILHRRASRTIQKHHCTRARRQHDATKVIDATTTEFQSQIRNVIY